MNNIQFPFISYIKYNDREMADGGLVDRIDYYLIYGWNDITKLNCMLGVCLKTGWPYTLDINYIIPLDKSPDAYFSPNLFGEWWKSRQAAIPI